jgi:signal transduction histidine kinase
VKEFFGLDDDWERPLPEGWFKRDALIAGVVFLSALLGLEVFRASGALSSGWPRWAIALAAAVGVAPLVWRRRFPVTVMMLTAAHMFVAGVTQPAVMANIGMQAAYFFAIFTALAWARDRRIVFLAACGVVIFMFGWLAVQWSVASVRDELVASYQGNGSREGALFGPGAAAVLYGLMVNVLYFATAVGAGAVSWRGARARARAVEQARTITRQSDQLTEQAVVEERLRIARELHDVVAHHVAAIGIQAAAARKLMAKNPERATDSLSNVEASSREAVTQMRALLGTLRAEGQAGASGTKDAGEGETVTARTPEPGLSNIAALVDEVRSATFDVHLDNLVDVDVPANIGHSIYRTVQEALANVQRHSTATAATVTLRTGEERNARYVEAEVLDDGRPRSGTSGSGLGLLGMRERVTAHRGTAEIGPRLTGGYRVRVRLPLDAATKTKETA